MYCCAGTLTGGCGVGLMYSFTKDKILYSDQINIKNHDFEDYDSAVGGCGWQIACFIDTKECAQMYKEIKERFPIVYQSPIRHNVNSDNNFFFVVFDTGQPNQEDDTADIEPDGFPNGLEW